MKQTPNIFLDIDDVVFDWQEAYAKRFSTKVLKNWGNSNLKHRRLTILSLEKDFWLNLPIKNIPNFVPKGFVSARGIPKLWTKQSLTKFNIPGRSNLHQVHWGESKINLLKSLNCDIFVDDKIETFRDCHRNNIFCLLMNAPHNQKVKTKYRIYDLDIDKIMEKYDSLCSH